MAASTVSAEAHAARTASTGAAVPGGASGSGASAGKSPANAAAASLRSDARLAHDDATSSQRSPRFVATRATRYLLSTGLRPARSVVHVISSSHHAVSPSGER